MRRNLQRILSIIQMELNDIGADTQRMLTEIRIIKKKITERSEDEKSEE